MMRRWQRMTCWALLGFLGLCGCDRSATETSEADDATGDKPATVKVEKVERPALVYEADQQAAAPKANEDSRSAAAIDTFAVDKFTFEFHRETKKEVCGDWDYFAYNGSMSLAGRIQSRVPINMGAGEFELELETPLETYLLPAQRERETLDGDVEIEQVITQKRNKMIFYIKDYRVDDDDTVYRNDDDETGKLKNYGPLIDAMFDWESGKFVISVTRAELSPQDIEAGEEFSFTLSMPRGEEQDDFEVGATLRYNGPAIDSERYYFTGDCPD